MKIHQRDQLTDIFGCKWNEDTVPESESDNGAVMKFYKQRGYDKIKDSFKKL